MSDFRDVSSVNPCTMILYDRRYGSFVNEIHLFTAPQIIPSSHHTGQGGSALLEEFLDLPAGLERFSRIAALAEQCLKRNS